MNSEKGLLRRMGTCWQLYVMLLIPLAYIIIFAYIPMAGVQLAFREFTPAGGIWGGKWIGVENFTRFFSSYQFSRVLRNTLSISLYSLIAGFPIPIILALLLNTINSERMKKLVQNITYIPHFISVVVMVGMIMQVLNPRIGIIGLVYTAVTGEAAPNFIGKPELFPHIYVWSGIWQSLGWNSIIYIAALSSVDVSLYEAAKIDGATPFQRMIFIDLPFVLPTAIVILIINAGQIMNVGFEKTFLMQNSMNISTSEVISTYVYKVGLSGASGNFSFATAVGLFNSVVNLILISIVNGVSRRFSSQSLW